MAVAYNSIIDSARMYNLYRACQSHETYTAKLWDNVYINNFGGDNWTYSMQQYVYLDLRNGKLQLDGLLEKYVPKNDVHLAIMIREDKKHGRNAREVESQAVLYADIMVKERMLNGLWIQTTLGSSFRTWYYDASTKKLDPLFGGPGKDPAQYVDAMSSVASTYWDQWVAAITGTPLQWKAPTLASSASVAYTPVGSASSAPVPPGGTVLDVVWSTPTFNDGEGLTDITFLNANLQYETLRSRTSNWTYDESRKAMVWFCNTHQMWYGYQWPLDEDQ